MLLLLQTLDSVVACRVSKRNRCLEDLSVWDFWNFSYAQSSNMLK